MCTGAAVSVCGSLVGLGGGMLLVPILLLLYPDAKPCTVAFSSMAVVAVTSISATTRYALQRRIDYRIAAFMAVSTIPGAVLGGWSVRYVDPRTFKGIFGILLCLLSLLTAAGRMPGRGGDDEETTGGESTEVDTATCLIASAASFFSGFTAAFLGIGGGILKVPVIAFLVGLPMHRATATSQAILVFTSTTGVATQYLLGTPPLPGRILVPLALGAMLGGQAGPIVSQRLAPRVLKRTLAVFMGMAGLRLCWSAWAG